MNEIDISVPVKQVSRPMDYRRESFFHATKPNQGCVP